MEQDAQDHRDDAKMKTKLIVLLVIVLLVLAASPVLASIGDVLWARKCPAEASVIVTEFADGTSLVECFLYIEREEHER